jgi:hypothetical protein
VIKLQDSLRGQKGDSASGFTIDYYLLINLVGHFILLTEKYIFMTLYDILPEAFFPF